MATRDTYIRAFIRPGLEIDLPDPIFDIPTPQAVEWITAEYQWHKAAWWNHRITLHTDSEREAADHKFSRVIEDFHNEWARIEEDRCGDMG
jgi:hypothetical protein